MKSTDRWDDPDWNRNEPVQFTGLHLMAGSAFMAILPGGILVAIALAVWYLAIP